MSECTRIQAKLQTLPELEVPGGQELEAFCAIGGETLEELREFKEISDSVCRDAKELHLNICFLKDKESKSKKDSQHCCDQKAEEIATAKRVDTALTFALAGCVVVAIPLFVYGATFLGSAACIGGAVSAGGKGVQNHFTSQAEAELKKKREDSAKAEKSVVAYTRLDFSADPFSKGLDKLDGHLRALEDILASLLTSVARNEFHQVFSLRKKLDKELSSS
ncbi:unnamed protein product [Closterium sp. Yama58-4]|nr:unnamed protein product [Closterium sp. Yama58-4]